MPLMWPVVSLLLLIVVLFLVERRYPEMTARLEENILAILLATITLVSFTQVIARYGFNTGWQGALEFTRVMFAWMILFGMSYGIRNGTHLGVDALIRLFPKPVFRVFALFGAVACFAYGAFLIHAGWVEFLGGSEITNWRQSGALGYWKFMFDRGTGLDDLRYPLWMQETFGLQERVQRWIAYLMLPIGLSLVMFRSIQAFVEILRGTRELIIAGHEAEDLVAENKDALAD